jgi:hypothetical protein
MKNENEIVKKILLSMKYDSRKTMSENKKIILEDDVETCEDVRKKILHNLDQSVYGVEGQLRSAKYPQWGKWGDGKCICSRYNPPQGYKEKCSFKTGFSTKCCKKGSKPQITIDQGDITQEKDGGPKAEAIKAGKKMYNDMAINGDQLELPVDTKVTKLNKSQYTFAYEDEPQKLAQQISKIKAQCEWLNKTGSNELYGFKDENDCLAKYGTSLLNIYKDDSVSSFEYSGLTFTPCFSTGPKTKPLRPEEIVFKGYYGADFFSKESAKQDGDCVGIKWSDFVTTIKDNEFVDNKNNSQLPNVQGLDQGLGDSDELSIIF